jgi:hypothetical protein
MVVSSVDIEGALAADAAADAAGLAAALVAALATAFSARIADRIIVSQGRWLQWCFLMTRSRLNTKQASRFKARGGRMTDSKNGEHSKKQLSKEIETSRRPSFHHREIR